MSSEKNVVSFPHAVGKAVKVAHELVLTHEWDHVFPNREAGFSTGKFLGNPPEIAVKVAWDKVDPKQPRKLDDQELLHVTVEMHTCTIFLDYHRPTVRVDWELAKIKLYSPDSDNPEEIESVENPRKRFFKKDEHWHNVFVEERIQKVVETLQRHGFKVRYNPNREDSEEPNGYIEPCSVVSSCVRWRRNEKKCIQHGDAGISRTPSQAMACFQLLSSDHNFDQLRQFVEKTFSVVMNCGRCAVDGK